MHSRVAYTLQTQSPDRPLVLAQRADNALGLRDLQGAHNVIFTPRDCSMVALERRLLSPCSVARTRLTEVVEPKAFVSTSLTPASSNAARTAPPAITPVPSEAGLSITDELSNLPKISCGMVVPRIGTSNISRLALSWPLEIATGTVFAFPRPTPTRPLPSPTTTRALKLKRRPPLTTLATRRISTTRSWRSEPPSRSRPRPPRPPSLPPRAPRPDRGTCCHHGQRSRFLSRRRRPW